MKSWNTYYTTSKELESFLLLHSIKDNDSLLVQVFTSFPLKEQINKLLSDITLLLPNAVVIGATTDGEIMNGRVSVLQTVLSFTQFQKTKILCASARHTNNAFVSGKSIAKNILREDTRVIITFVSGLNSSGESYLKGISSVDKNVIVAGGLAGDNAEFVATYVFTKNEILDYGAVGVSLNGVSLHAHNEYAYNWDRVGAPLTVTRAEGNRVYSIDNRKAYDIYAHYLGDKIAQRLPESGTEFPLIIRRAGMDISRAVLSVESDGSLIFAGDLKTGDSVQFGYGNINGIFEQSLNMTKHVSQQPAEAIFIYSCMARRHYLSEEIEIETLPFNTIAPTAGFFTYGEFFTLEKKELLNQAMTLLILSESNTTKKIDEDFSVYIKDNLLSSTNTINALANLVRVASSELNEKTKQLQEQRKSLYHQAHYDSLTGLANRILFHDRLLHAIELKQRNNHRLALLFIDLDNFKKINDSLGHDTGDEFLKAVAQRLENSSRDSDTLARLSGDEFAVIIEDFVSLNSVSVYAQKILRALSKEFSIEANTFYISCSIGISLFPEDSDNPKNLLKYADVAMYKAKQKGKNNFQFYSSSMTKAILESIELEKDLRKAIAKEEFEIYYQPQINAKSKVLKGVEALIRWKHQEKGYISPAIFIPFAEKSWLIRDIDTWVMQEAIKQISTLYAKGLNPEILSLNLAMKQLESDSFIPLLQDTMSKYSLKPSLLKLELLERDIMQNPQESIIKLQEISRLGVSLAIDDFGTGQSSLTYLKKFPLNELKIDKTFVDDVPRNDEDNAIVKAIIALGEALSLEIIAEGVERREQMEFLLENGCENIQGYYFSKPMPLDKLEEFLLQREVFNLK